MGISSCAPLSKSQLKMSHNYFEAVANYPRYYREMNMRVADLDLESKNLESSLSTSDSSRIATIIYSINAYEQAMQIPPDVTNHVKNIDEYIQEYYLLLPNGFNIYRALKGTTETIGGLFGVGGVVSGILPNNIGGLSASKKRKIRSHLLESESELITSLSKLQAFIDAYYLPKLEEIDKKSIVYFEALLESISGTTPPIDYYVKHNRMLTDFYQKLYLTRSTVKQLSKAINSFMVVEKEITSSFQEKNKVDLEETHLDNLIGDIQRISFLVKDLKGSEKSPENKEPIP